MRFGQQCRMKALLRFVKREYALVIGLLIILFFLAVSVLASVIATHPPNQQNLLKSLRPPSPDHIFGTDELGRDLFSRVIHGSRVNLPLAVFSIISAYMLALPFGLTAGFKGGRIDNFISQISDSFLTFPSLVLSVVLVSIIGTGQLGLYITIVITKAPALVRLIRGYVIQNRNKNYVEAARALGCSDMYIMVKHILPNILGPTVVVISLFASEALLLTAALGFLGLGVQPPTPEWGTMLSRSRNYFMQAPHLMIFPGLSISLLILGFNLFGDGLRDFLDSKKYK